MALGRKEVPSKMIRLIRALYMNAELAMFHRRKTRMSATATYLRHCSRSYHEPINPAEKRHCMEVYLTSRRPLDFTEAICLLSHKLSVMQAKAHRFVNLARAVRLELNINKTKAMRVDHNIANHILIDGCPVEFVKSFCYLSCTDIDVDCTLNKARAAFKRMYAVRSSSQISSQSVLRYGSETWLVSNSITQRLQTFINKCLRIICRIFWPNAISNVALLKLTDEEPMLRQIERRKWR